MSHTEVVTVVMPAFNRAAYIGQAIESVIAQTCPNWTLRIVDDGSTDDTAAAVAPYLSDPRIHYVKQENSGQAVARNRGARAGSGRYICFLDSDNAWMPEKLERQLSLMAGAPQVGVLYGEVDFIDEAGNPLPRQSMRRHSGRITRELLIDNFVTFNTSMVRRESFELVGGFDERIRRADDYDLWLRLSAHCEFLHQSVVWAKYRVMRAQISSDKTGRFAAIEDMLSKFFDANPAFAQPAVLRETWCRFHTRRGRYYASIGRRLEALRDYVVALGRSPFSRHPWRALARLVVKGG